MRDTVLIAGISAITAGVLTLWFELWRRDR